MDNKKIEQKKKNKDATIGIWLSLVGMWIPILQPVALYYGYRGFRVSQKTGVGKSKAIIAMICGGLFTILMTLAVLTILFEKA